eukprot:Nitzschia sp. Nitz4//scaffold95_size97785//22908//23327//NITZ4_004657-RA/size97785-processed-gene-0.4-mRNA-1//1//CDS//3329560442//9295//frame0
MAAAVRYEPDIFLCLKVSGISTSPSNMDFQKLAGATLDYYSDFLQARHNDNLHKINLSVRNTKFEAGIPEKDYNVYVEWDISVGFNDASKAPSKKDLCESMVSEIDLFSFLKDYIRELPGTPFENSVGLYTEQLNSLLE